jgi:hypothetical protein
LRFRLRAGALILLIAIWSIVALATNVRKTAASTVAVNIVLNLGFFLTHSISTPYYLMPLVLLSMWTLLFSFLNDPRSESANPPGQLAVANVVKTGPRRK